jgi:hypothetical protein
MIDGEGLDPDLAEMAAKLNARYGDTPPPAPEPPPAQDANTQPKAAREYDPSLLPDDAFFASRPQISNALHHLKEDIDAAVSIFDIYDHFVGKQRETGKAGQYDGIHCSCPVPTHPDNHPSMWCNLDGLWYCGSCEAKGDKYTIVGLQLGLESRGKDFKDIIVAIADAFHIEYIRSEITGRILEKPSTASITITPDEVHIEPPPPEKQIEPLDWKNLFPKGTFGRSWMDALAIDDLPEEYYVWLALQAIGMALGRDTYTPDSPNIYGNLYVVLFGPTGIGKSRAIRHMMTLLDRALPYNHSDPRSKGAFQMPMPGSPEALIDSFSRPIYEDETEKKIVDYGSVRAIVAVDEFASLLSKSDQSRGALKSQFTTLYDVHDRIAIHSRGHGTSIAMYPFCSVVASTQPTAIRTSLGYNDLISGFLNRHIFAIGTPKKRYSMNRPTIELREPIADLMALRAWASQGRQISHTPEAYTLFDEFFHSQIETINFENDPIMARIDLTLRKVLLLLAANEKSKFITEDIVKRTIHIFHYLKSCYDSISGNVVSSASNDLSEWLVDFCREFPFRKKRHGPTLREIQKALPKRFDNRQLLDEMSNVEKIGIIVPTDIKHEGGGRPTKLYVYHY